MSDKSVRYDRQLRLWGESGQSYLESSHVCLLSANAVGTETLKNLVLPGIGKFTIVDDQKVTPYDIGNNFFLSNIGSPRAKDATELLTEMNEFVPGTYVIESPDSLIEKNIDFFSQFSLIIVCIFLKKENLLKISKFCFEKNIPLFVLKTNGFFGTIRIVVPEHTILDSKEERFSEDLRLSKPFPELQEYINSVVYDENNTKTPFIALLPKLLERWSSKNDGKIPKTSKEKDDFKSTIKHPKNAENFQQAKQNAYKVYTPYNIPSSVQEVLSDKKIQDLNKNSSDFWVIASAINQFVKNEGNNCLPLLGSIPDLHTTTQEYIKLQDLYFSRSKKDFEIVNNYVNTILNNINNNNNNNPSGTSSPPSIRSISPEDVRDFCKKITQIGLVRYRSVEDEYNPQTVMRETFENGLGEGNWQGRDDVQFYLLFRATEEFYSQHNRFPGALDNEVEPDITLLKSIVNSLLHSIGFDDPTLIKEEYIHEFCRSGGSEVHTIAAFIGGIAAQEIVKIITHQWTPLNNTLIYDGIHSTTASLIF